MRTYNRFKDPYDNLIAARSAFVKRCNRWVKGNEYKLQMAELHARPKIKHSTLKKLYKFERFKNVGDK